MRDSSSPCTNVRDQLETKERVKVARMKMAAEDEERIHRIKAEIASRSMSYHGENPDLVELPYSELGRERD